MSLIPQAQRGPAGPPGPAGGGLPLSGVLALGNQSGTFDIEMGIVGTQKAEITNASIIESERLELVNGASFPTIEMTTSAGGSANIQILNPSGLQASIDYADVNKKITVQSDAISLDAGGGGLVEMTAVGAVGITAGAGQNITVNAPSGTTLITGATTNLDNVAFISKVSGTMSIQAGAFVNVENFNFNATTISPSIVNADMTLQTTTVDGTSATASKAVSIVSDGVGGQANPELKITNNNATGSVALEIYKNKPTAGLAGDVLFNQSVYGKDSGNTKQEYTRISHTLRDGTAGVEDGSIEMSCFVNGAVATFLQLNGNENEVNVLKTLDMTGNTIRTNTGDMSITTATSTGTGNLAITSKGTTNLTGGGAITITNSGGSGDISLETNGSIFLKDAGSTALSLSSASGATFDLGGGTMSIIGASTRTIQTTGVGTGLNIIAGAGSLGAVLTLKSSSDQAVVLEGNSLTLNGASMTSPGVGGLAGINLQVMINGVNYCIPLYNP